MEASRILARALDIGEMMLLCGGEVSRVEDTIGRILRAYGARRADIFTITSSIVVTLDMDGTPITQTRRIYDQQNDLDKLNQLNSLSRRICKEKPDCDEIQRCLDQIRRGPRYSMAVQYFAYALISAAFSLFFGGTWKDACVSAPIGPLLLYLPGVIRKVIPSGILTSALCAFLGGTVAAIAVLIGLDVTFDKIVIGNIMLLIPGIALTNSLRDMLSGDTLSGLTRLTQAVLVAMAVATGFALASRWIA